MAQSNERADPPGALKISVIGCGYLGAVHAASMAELGHEVVGVEVDVEKAEALAAGRVPFFEPGFEELLQRSLASGRLSFSPHMKAAAGAAVHFLCVGTPQRRGEYAADLTYVEAATASLLDVLGPGELVVGKSTVPVGTAARLAELVAERVPEAALAWNPEFLREGFAVQDTLHPDRLVYGVADSAAGGAAGAGAPPVDAEALLDRVYAPIVADRTPKVVTDYATAEMVKTAANSFLATKISFINAMAELCEATGADVKQLADAIGHDDRIGRKFLNAGLGFGGGCLPKDIRAFMARAGELGADQALTFLREVDNINMRRRIRMVELARQVCDDSLLGKRIAVLGAAFKPDSDDIRDSPALNVAAQLQLQGANVRVTDPQALPNVRRQWAQLDCVDTPEEAAEGADAVLLLTEWRQYKELDPAAFGSVVKTRRVLDGRNALDREAWEAAGWTYRALGRRNV
ncbi:MULTISPECIES: UDP-glucose dehydrogenase family protein [Pseudonocardia]|uniref:UDP-glucose 6-dehydrogenase n=2 Tax=Pseudonocardia TaxID=1847 RepID=A0A1Y2N8Z0_PSEAH|nr:MULTISPECIES: UDP-glucose/GDP-mannose dehydrogenase family protein [Pseudonocardia]OSY43671.1 UDP-glucose 6-dehydrogenase YwqF [Pseudonocardia autotrophica]TDN73339.1 UDPglucose 6-dehydrogenase [Pseudonocardia autotrophica]BBG04077.1 UDP-glucose 6-dehydrogenase [Pseudonocardia autotrophica]GEC26214.1 UDP-glucose 6-dehydrogenase [Pseudonocardia saturnea]